MKIKNVMSKEEYKEFIKNKKILKRTERGIRLKNCFLPTYRKHYTYGNGKVSFCEILNWQDPEFKDRYERDITPPRYAKAHEFNENLLKKIKTKNVDKYDSFDF